MRINVYAEELTQEVELIEKSVTDEKFGTRIFYGVRMYLQSPDVLHYSPEDDDRSAITFWVPWTWKQGNSPKELVNLFESMTATSEGIPEG